MGGPINITYGHVINGTCLSEFRSNGEYIISTFDKDIEKYLKSHFPNLNITFKENLITITNYLNRDIILKRSGI
jgi:hypothetical protein